MQTLSLREVGNVWRNPRLGGRIAELDGVRGLAILLVLIEHYIRDASHIPLARWESWILVPFRLSWSGVDLFFVLSGFLIGGILIDAKGADNYYSTFYIRRFYRIFPVYYLWLALFFVGLYLSSSGLPGVKSHEGLLHTLFNRHVPLWTYPLYLQNVAMSLRGTTGPMWLGITWSLAVEEQFYLLLPLAIRHLETKGIQRLALGAILVAPVLRGVLLAAGSGPLAPYMLLPCRADALGYGVILATIVRSETAWKWITAHRRHILLFFSMLGVAICLLTKLPYESASFMSIGFSALAVFYTALLLLVLANPGKVTKTIFSVKPLMKLGTVAYAVYLFHAGISFVCHGLILGAAPSIDSWPAILVTILSVGVVLLVATISWRVMEGPLVRLAHSRFHYSFSAQESGEHSLVS